MYIESKALKEEITSYPKRGKESSKDKVFPQKLWVHAHNYFSRFVTFKLVLTKFKTMKLKSMFLFHSNFRQFTLFWVLFCTSTYRNSNCRFACPIPFNLFVFYTWSLCNLPYFDMVLAHPHLTRNLDNTSSWTIIIVQFLH